MREKGRAQPHTLNTQCPVSTPEAAQNTPRLNGAPAYTSCPHSQEQDLDPSSISSNCLMRTILITEKKTPKALKQICCSYECKWKTRNHRTMKAKRLDFVNVSYYIQEQMQDVMFA